VLRALLVLLALLVLPRGSGAATADDELVAKAKQEGRVVVYFAGAAQRSNALGERFRATYGITADFLRMGSDEMPIRIMTEDRGGVNNVDAVMMPQLQMGLLAQSGLLASYKPPETSELLARTFDPEGVWGSTVFLETAGIAFNPVRLRALGLKPPVNWEDLARPEWRGRFGITSNDVEFYTALRRFYGKERTDQLVRALAANEPHLLASHTLGLTLIVSGELLGMASAYGPDAVELKKKGSPIDYVMPTPTVLTLAVIAIAKKAPHPNAARLFTRWWLARSNQQWFSATFGVPSARKDVKSDPELLNPKVRYTEAGPGNSADYSADVRAFRTTFNLPG
jgi:iron(III) transport system substrate-binding protein